MTPRPRSVESESLEVDEPVETLILERFESFAEDADEFYGNIDGRDLEDEYRDRDEMEEPEEF